MFLRSQPTLMFMDVHDIIDMATPVMFYSLFALDRRFELKVVPTFFFFFNFS